MHSNEPVQVEFHADDYGLFPEQSKRILHCMEHGALNGVSIMPNSPYLQECMQMLAEANAPRRTSASFKDSGFSGSADVPESDTIRSAAELSRPHPPVFLTIHLNLVEGKALSPLHKVSSLTDPDGVFRPSFGKLLLVSCVPVLRGRFLHQIRTEFRHQIRRCKPYFDDPAFCQQIRLDSHVHFHMIPVVFDAMIQAAKLEDLHPSYIRIPKEPVFLYLKHLPCLEHVRPVNFLKVLILNLLALRARLRYGSTPLDAAPALFSGVMLSGYMSKKNVRAILPDFLALCKKKNQGLEMLFHPGAVCSEAELSQVTSADDKTFFTDAGRSEEAEALIALKNEPFVVRPADSP